MAALHLAVGNNLHAHLYLVELMAWASFSASRHRMQLTTASAEVATPST